MSRRIGTTTLRHLLDDERVRKTDLNGRLQYAAVDVIGELTDAPDPVAAEAEWEALKQDEPTLRTRCTRIELPGAAEPQDVLPLAGVLRLVQMLDSPKADRLRGWLADAAAQAVEEEEDPELTIQRMRQGYEARGHSRRWIDQRLRSVSARHEVAGEWYKRGMQASDQFRVLTNALLQSAFGMDTATYRAEKGLTATGANLRDRMSDHELALLSLAESSAAILHRRRGSQGLEQLLQDVTDAGTIAAQTREAIERAARPAARIDAA